LVLHSAPSSTVAFLVPELRPFSALNSFSGFIKATKCGGVLEDSASAVAPESYCKRLVI
jgi:hypothetical protein